MFRVVVASAIMALLTSAAWADENFRTIAVAGDWVAGSHSPSAIAAPDVCLALSVTGHVGFRTDELGTQFRVVDESWSLPADAHGMMQVAVGPLKKALDTVTASSNMVTALLSTDEATEILSAMDHASVLTITVGNAKPRVISLAGSTKVTNAYRTCAGLHGSSPDGGANPFAPTSHD